MILPVEQNYENVIHNSKSGLWIHKNTALFPSSTMFEVGAVSILEKVDCASIELHNNDSR